MKELNQLRWTNLVGMSIVVFTATANIIASCLFNSFLFGSLALLGGYIFVYFSFWFFLVFIVYEIKYVLKNKLNIITHLASDRLAFYSVLSMPIYIVILILAKYLCE